MLPVKEMPAELKPFNRYLAHNGNVGALNNAEVLQLVYSFKTLDAPVQLLNRAGGLDGLATLTPEEITALDVDGVGPKAIAAIKAALELGRRLMTVKPSDRPQIRCKEDVFNMVGAEMMLLDHEELRVLLLDTKNFVTGVHLVYSGSLNTAVLRVAEVFREAIRRNACSILVIHNHPSGDPTPSLEDVRTTELIVEAGKLLDIAVLDHVVIGRNYCVSLKERGLGF